MKLRNLHLSGPISKAMEIVTLEKSLMYAIRTSLYGNALYLMLDTLALAMFGFFFWMIAARFYTEIEVGFSSAILSAITLLATFSLGGLNISLIRFMPQSDQPRNLINTSLTLVGITSVAMSGIFIAGMGLWTPSMTFLGQNILFYPTLPVLSLLLTLSFVSDAVFLALRRTKFTLIKDIIFSVIKLSLPIFLASFLRIYGLVLSWGIALGIATAISFFLFLPKAQKQYKIVPTLNLNLAKSMWRYSSGNYLANLLMAAPSLILPLEVVNRLGAESNAYFYIAWLIGSTFFAVPSAASASLFAEASHFEGKLTENINKSLKLTYLLLIPALILLISVGRWLLLAFGRSYSINAFDLVLILGLSSLPLGINYAYVTLLRVRKRIDELMLISGATAATVLVVSYIILPISGIIGVGYTWLGAQTILAIYIISTRKLVTGSSY